MLNLKAIYVETCEAKMTADNNSTIATMGEL